MKGLVTGVVFLLLIHNIALSQDNPYVEQVTVVGEYMPRIQQAKKILFQPDRKDTSLQKKPVNYSIISSPIFLKAQLKPIPPARTTGESFEKLFRNYIAVGAGNYATTYFEYAHSSLRHKTFRGILYLKHHATSGKLKNYPYPGLAENKAGLAGSFIMNNYTLSATGQYQNNVLHYYGFNDDHVTFEYSRKDIRQIFHLADIQLKGQDTRTEANFTHNETISYSGFWDKYNVSEHQLLGQFRMSAGFDAFSFFQKQTFQFELNGGYFTYKQNANDHSVGITKARPFFMFGMNELEIHVGGDLLVLLDTVSETLFYPFGQLDIKVVKDALKIFFSYSSDINFHSLRELTTQNPYVNTTMVGLEPSYARHILSGGLIGGFQGGMNYRVKLSNQRRQNMPLFINDTLAMAKDTFFFPAGNRFLVVYDDVDIFQVLTELQFFFGRKIKIDASLLYSIYSPQTQQKAWHMPLYQGWMQASYDIQKKFIPKVHALIIGDRYALFENRVHHLKPIVDFGLELEYRYNDFLRGWFKVQNVLARRYYYWYGFPSQKLQAFIGVSYIF